MKGYKFYTEEEAIQVRKLCADYKGLPINSNDITQFWVNYNYSKLDNFFYIQYVQELENVLGFPIEFEITQSTFENGV